MIGKSMQIGMIGGIGPAATDYYYRKLIRSYANRDDDLDMTIVHADTPTLLKNQSSNMVEAQTDIYKGLAERLERAGAGCVAVTSIAGHFCIDAFKEVSPLPVIDMLEAVSHHIEKTKIGRVGLIGTQTVMETRFYGGIKSADVIIPEGNSLLSVHEAYATMAATGMVTETQRSVFDTACQNLMTQERADAIILGGTDLALVYTESHKGFPVIDCASIHIEAIIDFAESQ